LRERLEDLEPLARTLLNRAGYRKVALSLHSVNVLKAHSWPGNIRELGNVLERAAIMAAGGVIEPEHLLLEEEPLSPESRIQQRLASSVQGLVSDEENSGFRIHHSELRANPQFPTPSPQEYIRAGLSVQEMEERLIQKTLSEVNDNRTQAAKLLGISVRTLRNKLRLYHQKSVASCQ
jgi:two-component system response regulator FlrC